MVEYGLLLALIAVIAIVAVSALGDSVSEQVQRPSTTACS